MIEIEGVSFSYRTGQLDEVPVLHDLVLTVEPGEQVAVIGHNGSGKSTLAKLLTALLYPTSGQIRVDGIQVQPSTQWDVRRRISIVFQDPDDQLVATRVIDDVAFGPENLGIPRAELRQRVDFALEALELQDLSQSLVAELSLGDKQRVGIAGALAMRPRYLVLDEPTVYLPARLAERLLRSVRELGRTENMAVLHITHHMPEAALFDRVVVLNAGKVVLDGHPRRIFQEADLLHSIGLDVPLPVRVSLDLRQAGFPLPQVALTPDELTSAVATLVPSALVEESS